ncbi:uncharacterized protein PAC_00172 [Phialocephala subalpina]|uniref:Major facilitator superfamily (MFS) profile domain-containing protein n=1 Tax=Phialocephala subalpina TaxID=576137 RepID=A0A1L7WBZ2_9HELO|nr:uncharacterized protein PAC_00172 [Phialocephala subalpina]
MGFLGILEDHKLPHVTGTVILNEEKAHSEAATGGLKHGEGSNRNLILVPQPSEDPNDPLSWPYRQKLACVLIVACGAIMNCTVLTGLLSTGFTKITIELKLHIQKIALLVGYQLLIGGICGTLVPAIARKWGKRLCFLFGGTVAIIGTIVDQCAQDYSTLLAGRMIGGAGISCWELLFLGTFIGGSFDTLFMFISFDPLIGWCTRKNKGNYEPEYRLIPTLLGLGSGATTIGFGYLVQHDRSHYAAAILHGVMLFGVIAALISTNS